MAYAKIAPFYRIAVWAEPPRFSRIGRDARRRLTTEEAFSAKIGDDAHETWQLQVADAHRVRTLPT